MRDLDQGQRGAGELGGQALDQLLVAVVRGREVEGRLAQLDGEDEEDADQHAGQPDHRLPAGLDQVVDVEAAGDVKEAEGAEDQHRLAGQHLHQLALGADVAVRAVGRVGAEDQEDAADGEGEDGQQEVATGEEDAAGGYGEDQEAEDVEVLLEIDRQVALLQQLGDIPEGLGDRRADPALHAGGEDAVGAGKQAAEDRGAEHEADHADEDLPGRQLGDHGGGRRRGEDGGEAGRAVDHGGDQ